MKAIAAATLPALLAMAAGIATARADCECLGNGTKYEQGQLACLHLPAGEITARCDKVLNNSSWTKIGDGCPEARAVTRLPEDAPPPGHGSEGEGFRLLDLFNIFSG